MIQIIRNRASGKQIEEMLESHAGFIKVAVDIRRKILAGGGVLHADCEAALLKDGSRQTDIWGADWIPETQEVAFESIINIRPRQGNRSMTIEDPILREQVRHAVEVLLGGKQDA